VLGELRRMEAELDALGAVEGGSIAVGVLPVAAVGILPGTLIALRAAHSGLRVHLHQGRTEELLPLLASRELDLVVGRLYAPAVPDGFQRLPMWEEPIAVLARARHPLLRRRGAVTAAALAGYEMVVPTVSQRVGQEIEHLLALLGLPQDPALRSSSYGFIREMLLASGAVSIMPRSMMVGDLLRGALRVVPLPVPAPPRPAGIILRADPPPSPAVSAFVKALRAHLAEIETRGGLGGMPGADGLRRKSDTTGRAKPR
jgi:LysR family pca operon transcriptional activator